MGELGERLRLTEEAQRGGFGGQGDLEKLEGDLALELFVVGEVDPAHAALTQLAEDGEAPDARAGVFHRGSWIWAGPRALQRRSRLLVVYRRHPWSRVHRGRVAPMSVRQAGREMVGMVNVHHGSWLGGALGYREQGSACRSGVPTPPEDDSERGGSSGAEIDERWRAWAPDAPETPLWAGYLRLIGGFAKRADRE